MPGAAVCDMHGGEAPQVRAAAERRQAVLAIREELAEFEPDLIDPIDALLQQLGLAAAWERYLRREVAALEGLEGKGIGGSAKAAVLVELWNEERDRLTKYAKLAVEVGLAERIVKQAEQVGAMMADLIREVLDDPQIGLSEQQRLAAQQVATQRLRLAQAS